MGSTLVPIINLYRPLLLKRVFTFEYTHDNWMAWEREWDFDPSLLELVLLSNKVFSGMIEECLEATELSLWHVSWNHYHFEELSCFATTIEACKDRSIIDKIIVGHKLGWLKVYDLSWCEIDPNLCMQIHQDMFTLANHDTCKTTLYNLISFSSEISLQNILGFGNIYDLSIEPRFLT